MSPTILLTETRPTNHLSPNISLSEFPIIESTPIIQDKTTTPNNASEDAWSTLAQQKLTMDPNISAFTRLYCYVCKRTV